MNDEDKKISLNEDNYYTKTKTNSEKPSIHFVLPGGGVKGCFQAGFMYHLCKYFPDSFSLYQIDGCSVGALNSFAIASNNVDGLKETWDNISCMDDVFGYQSKIPIWNGIKTLYNAYYHKGIYRNNLKKVINRYDIPNENNLHKFNCVVSNLRTGTFEYKNGTNPKIRDYVLASSNPWIVSAPIKVEEQIYTDGALLQTYPIEYFKDSPADLKIIVGYDEQHFEKYSNEGNNMLFYIARIIDICRNSNENIKITEQLLEEQKDIILINSPMKIDTLTFDKTIIKDGFNMGMQAASKFVINYLK